MFLGLLTVKVTFGIFCILFIVTNLWLPILGIPAVACLCWTQ